MPDATQLMRQGLISQDALDSVSTRLRSDPSALNTSGMGTTTLPDSWTGRYGEYADKARQAYEQGGMPAFARSGNQDAADLFGGFGGAGTVRWTPEMIATMTRMANQGARGQDIVNALGGGMTKQTAILKMHELGLPVRGRFERAAGWSQDQIARLREMDAQGAQIPEQAQEFGVTEKALHAMRDKIGLQDLRPAPALPAAQPRAQPSMPRLKWMERPIIGED